jgi:hypothetical protein
MRKLLTLAIPIVLGVGLLTAALNNQGDGTQASRRQGGVAAENALPAVIEESPSATATADTTPATEPAPAAPETTTTTAAPAPSTTSTTAKPTATTAAKPKAPATTTTTMMIAASDTPADAPPSTIDCGTGSASARALLARSGTSYVISAKVNNESNRDIELDALVVRANYGGTIKQFTVPVSGKTLQAAPGTTEMTFTIPESASDAPPASFEISEFRFHTAGLPECASH